MWSFILRRLLYSIPVYLGIILIVMAALRVTDPVTAYLGLHASKETVELRREDMGLNRPFLPISRYHPEWKNVEPWLKFSWTRQPEVAEGDDAPPAAPEPPAGETPAPAEITGIALYNPFDTQYVEFIWRILRLDFGDSKSQDRKARFESWKYEGQPVGAKLREAVGPSLSLTIPAMMLSTVISITIGLISAYFRGSWLDRTLMFLVVLGMSVSVLVFIILGQKFGGYWLGEALGWKPFASNGYERWVAWSSLDLGPVGLPYPTSVSLTTWAYYCLLPVLIYVIVAIGYDTRFYRAVMVEETTRDYIITAIAKGASRPKIMFVHMLKNAMIPIITRVMITLPFLIAGSILLETLFRIPGMGKLIIESIRDKDFPIIQTFTAVFAAIFILSNILTDILYALVDPRVRLS